MSPRIDKIVAGKWLINAVMVGDKEGDRGTETRAQYDYIKRHDQGTNPRTGDSITLENVGKLMNKYVEHYGLEVALGLDGKGKITEDSLASLKNESKEWRIEVLYFCRKAANADWEFESALGNISKKEMDLLQYYHKELGVSWGEIPQSASEMGIVPFYDEGA